VEDAFVNRVIDERDRGLQQCLYGRFILIIQRCAELANLVAQFREVHTVALGTLPRLLDALES